MQVLHLFCRVELLLDLDFAFAVDFDHEAAAEDEPQQTNQTLEEEGLRVAVFGCEGGKDEGHDHDYEPVDGHHTAHQVLRKHLTDVHAK